MYKNLNKWKCKKGLLAAFLGVAIYMDSRIAAVAVDASVDSSASDSSLQEVVVTGSRITRADAETAVNVEVISAREIQDSRQETVADCLRTISTFGNSTSLASPS